MRFPTVLLAVAVVAVMLVYAVSRDSADSQHAIDLNEPGAGPNIELQPGESSTYCSMDVTDGQGNVVEVVPCPE